MEPPVTAVYDANVLYPAPLRDMLIRLAHAGLVRAKWTDAIHEEWIRNVLNDKPHLSANQLARTRSLMNESVRDCLITGFEDRIDSLALPDNEDRHVLAAAIHCSAAFIITFNLRDFPAETLAAYSIKAVHPDDFLMDLLNIFPEAVCSALKRQREALKNPPKTAEELLVTLANQGLRQAVGQLPQFIELL